MILCFFCYFRDLRIQHLNNTKHDLLLSKRIKLLFATSILVITASAQVSNPYDYMSLSHVVNAKLKDSLKKKWEVPSAFKNKETQKKYKEFWEARTNFVVNAITNKSYISEREVYNYLDNILTEIQTFNSKLIPKKPILLIDRSSSVNAYSVGGNIIAVNLGLISFASSKEEIALVMAHELAHDILGHAERSMKESAEWLTSEEYKKSLNAILDSKYERLSRLKKVMETYSFNRTQHSRYHETEADSLAIELLKKTKISFDPNYFLRLDSADLLYMEPLNKPVQQYFSLLNLPFEESWIKKRSKGLSSKNYNFQNTTELDDSLKTHPDCKERYERTRSKGSTTISLTPIPSDIVKKVNKMIIWNIFDNQDLTACLYRVLKENDKGNHDEWYHLMLYNIFSGLTYAENELNRFNAINIKPKEYISKSYYELQTMLEQMPKEALEKYYRSLGEHGSWQKLPADARMLKSLFFTILDKDASRKSKESSAKAFTAAHSNSMYCEFADHFISK